MVQTGLIPVTTDLGVIGSLASCCRGSANGNRLYGNRARPLVQRVEARLGSQNRAAPLDFAEAVFIFRRSFSSETALLLLAL